MDSICAIFYRNTYYNVDLAQWFYFTPLAFLFCENLLFPLFVCKNYSLHPPSNKSMSLDVKIINSDDYRFQMYFKFELMFY